MIPTLERAIALASPLEGAIDRFGRFVDRLPGGQRPRSGPAGAEAGPASTEALPAAPPDGLDQPG